VTLDWNKFEHRFPSPQCAIDIFKDHWASNVGRVVPGVQSGDSDIFADPRVKFAVDHLGLGDGTMTGMSVLELGPLEGGHTYQLEKSGAKVLAIEANVEAYLKCLIVKELTGMTNSRFELGDFNIYLEQSAKQFDLIFASGVLYHMPDPLKTLSDVSKLSDRCFIWTHYYDPAYYPGPERTKQPAHHAGVDATYWELVYPDMGVDKFWGGNKPVACWMTKQDIILALRAYGYDHVEVVHDHTDHPHGACMSLVAKR
jgi:hypothetical protein